MHLYVSGIFTLCWGLASLVLYKLYPIKAQLFFLIDTSHLSSQSEDKSTASPLKLREVSPLVNFPCPLQMHFRRLIDQVKALSESLRKHSSKTVKLVSKYYILMLVIVSVIIILLIFTSTKIYRCLFLLQRKSLFLDDTSLKAFHNPAFTLQETSSGISMTPSGGSPRNVKEHRPSHTIATPGGHVIDIETAIVASPMRRKISANSGHRVRVDKIFESNSNSEFDSRSCDTISQCSSRGSVS